MLTAKTRDALHLMRTRLEYLCVPPVGRAECRDDVRGVAAQNPDPGIETAINEGIAWLGRAQDFSPSADGGVASHYHLRTGWGTSYPEITGYVIPTMLAYAWRREDERARLRAKRMLDWLASIQLAEGGFQGGRMGMTPVIPVTFNTGQILLGLASGEREFGGYGEAMCRAADWLVRTQDPDGCWRKYPSPFTITGEKTYDTHVAWGLLEAARLRPGKPYAQAALANVNWALRWQRENGWFAKCCVSEPARPLAHTLGYVLRGIIEAYRFTHDEAFLKAASKCANGLLMALRDDGFLPGRLYPNWRGAVRWACLTGSVQTALCWLLLYQETGEVRYRDAAYATNQYVRRTMRVDRRPETRGAIKGSSPIYGGYMAYQYPAWACKFFVDANILERTVRADGGDALRSEC
jgi:hypothetical protein